MAEQGEQVRARLDSAECRAGLERALAGSTLVSRAGVYALDSGDSLLLGADDEPPAAERDGYLKLSRLLFLQVGDVDAQLPLPEQINAITCLRQTIYGREAENLLLRRCSDEAGSALLISVSNKLPASTAQALSQRLAAAGATTDLQSLLIASPDVLAGARLRLDDGELLATYRRADDASQVRITTQLGCALASLLEQRFGLDRSVAEILDASMVRVTGIDIEGSGRLLSLVQVPMVPRHVLLLNASGGIDLDILRRIQREAANDILRDVIAALLEGGLPTQMTPFPNTDAEFLAVVGELRALDEDDLIGRLDIGGFAPHGLGEGLEQQRCKECIYYLPHRRWCDIPELPLPVEAHWWCRLWKL